MEASCEDSQMEQAFLDDCRLGKLAICFTAFHTQCNDTRSKRSEINF